MDMNKEDSAHYVAMHQLNYVEIQPTAYEASCTSPGEDGGGFPTAGLYSAHFQGPGQGSPGVPFCGTNKGFLILVEASLSIIIPLQFQVKVPLLPLLVWF